MAEMMLAKSFWNYSIERARALRQPGDALAGPVSSTGRFQGRTSQGSVN
jgi:hypothetical protein